MRGVISAAGYVPYRRLDRSGITEVFGAGGGKGTRAVASFDEDTTTMGQAAAELALRGAPARPEALWFATSAPAYLEKTNAAAVHAALGLDPAVAALDFGGAIRSGVGALAAALTGRGCTLVVSADTRDGLPTGADEASAGDGAAAILVGDVTDGPVLAHYLGGASRTLEVTERWRVLGAARSQSWEERFGAAVYGPAVSEAWASALDDSGLHDPTRAFAPQGEDRAGSLWRGSGRALEPHSDDALVDHLLVAGLNARAVGDAVKMLAPSARRVVDPLISVVGNTATAHPALLLCSALEQARPGETIAVVSLADGVDVIVLRATDALSGYNSAASIEEQIAAGAPLSYGRFLAWRGAVAIEPPNRPPPSRPSAPAAYRRADWKYAFAGSQDRSSKMLHLPPARVSEKGGALDDAEPVAMSHRIGTVASFTIDRLAYSPSPPTVFAVVDFDGGGRAPLELTDVDADEVAVGMRVIPTFRRLHSAEGVHNYFWKAKPQRPHPPDHD